MQHLSILLVEDVELNVVVAKSILEKQGHYVDVAMNGEQAGENRKSLLRSFYANIVQYQNLTYLVI